MVVAASVGAIAPVLRYEVALPSGEFTGPRDYIYCTRISPTDPFRRFAERAKIDAGWRYHEMDASHSPHVTAPEALAALLHRIVTGGNGKASIRGS